MTPHETDEIGARIRATAATVSAPLALRGAISRERAKPQQHSRVQLALLGALLAVIATIAALVQPDPPTVERVATVALAAPTTAAPAGSDYLPGFEAIGARRDEVGGRDAETIIYRRGETGVHYTVVDGELDLPGTERADAGDLELALERADGINLVVWHREGKTCILSSRAATPEEMAELLRRA